VTKRSTKIAEGDNFYTYKGLSVSHAIVTDVSETFLTTVVNNVNGVPQTHVSRNAAKYVTNGDHFDQIGQSYISTATSGRELSNDSEIKYNVTTDVTQITNVSDVNEILATVTDTDSYGEGVTVVEHTVANIVTHVADVSDDKIIDVHTNGRDKIIVTTEVFDTLLTKEGVDSSVTNIEQILESDTTISVDSPRLSPQFTIHLSHTNSERTHKDLNNVSVMTTVESDILTPYVKPQQPPKTKSILTETTTITSTLYKWYSRSAIFFYKFLLIH
jgi:hypothetical protein